MEPAKLVVVPGAALGELKVHLLGENREAKLVGVQLQLQMTPGHDEDDDDDHNGDDDNMPIVVMMMTMISSVNTENPNSY